MSEQTYGPEVGQRYREKDSRFQRYVTILEIGKHYITIEGEFYGRKTKVRKAQFSKRFTYTPKDSE